ncbi:MAG TPA: DUF4124 domain-containing protein [Dokdonella sp.]
MPRPPTVLIALLLCLVATDAIAQKSDRNRFKWRDPDGNLHYSDALPAEAARYGYEIVSPQGIVLKRVAREKTAAELAAARAVAAREKAEHDAAEARARTDAQLVSNFPEEEDLQRAHRQRLEMLDQQVTAARISLRNQEQGLAELLGNAADSERAGKALSPHESSRIASMRKQVDAQRAQLDRRTAERLEAESRLGAELARYRELKARIEAPAPQG